MKARILEDIPLASFTTFGIGGPARYFVHALSEDAVLHAVLFAGKNNLPVFVLGGGSNLLVADRGFPGLVLKIGLTGIEWGNAGQQTIVRAGAGEEWDNLVRLCVERKLAGIECLSGIPGSVGGTPVQNIGAYGQEVSEVLVWVRAYDRNTGSIVDLSHDECGFAYRTSVFNTTEKDRYIVLSVTYSLAKNGIPSVRYPDVEKEFEGKASPPSLSEVRQAVRRIRARKAMLLVEGDPDCHSAGSFFKNPIVSEQQFHEIQAATRDEGMPGYAASPGKVKVAAAWLIEHSGFHKGYSLDRVGISTKHSLALINKGGATAEDVLRLAGNIRAGVEDKFGIRLTPEPVFLGFNSEVQSEFFG